MTKVEVYIPPAWSFVTTEELARKYIEDNAGDIYVVMGDVRVCLAEMPEKDRQDFIKKALRFWRRDRWLPYTLTDAKRAMERAEELAKGTPGKPFMGVIRR